MHEGYSRLNTHEMLAENIKIKDVTTQKKCGIINPL